MAILSTPLTREIAWLLFLVSKIHSDAEANCPDDPDYLDSLDHVRLMAIFKRITGDKELLDQITHIQNELRKE